MNTLSNISKIIFIIIALVNVKVNAQAAFHNFGNLRMHADGQIGFHTDVINDGDIFQNQGKVGFYNDNNITVSGQNIPVFYDVEVNVMEHLILETTVGVSNFQEFVNGIIVTPRDNKEVTFAYTNDTPYMGEDDDRFVDGYAYIKGDLDFTFPVGDDFRLRPIGIETGGATNTAKAAYYFEDPSFPNNFDQSFDTNQLVSVLSAVSIFEFWDLDGDQSTRVTLTWDNNSNIPTLVSDLGELVVVGWSKELQGWVDLGNTTVTGTLDKGTIVSKSIIPDEYEVLTFGSVSSQLDADIEIYNAISPNGDGLNDTFIVQGLERFPENELRIYNRWGVEVFYKKEYHKHQNFGGESEGRITIAKKEKLPTGTYYYVLKMKGEKDRVGYLYING